MASHDEADQLPLTETDRHNLAGGDENYVTDKWDDLKRIIGSTHLSSFLTISSLAVLFACSQR